MAILNHLPEYTGMVSALTTAVVVPATLWLKARKEANRASEAAPRVVAETRATLTASDITMSEFMLGVLKSQEESSKRALEAERTRTDEVRRELTDTLESLRLTRAQLQAAQTAIEAANAAAERARTQAEELKARLAELQSHIDGAQADRAELTRLRREMEILTLENNRLRTNLLAMRMLRETVIAHKANLPIDPSLLIDLENLDDEDSFDSLGPFATEGGDATQPD